MGEGGKEPSGIITILLCSAAAGVGRPASESWVLLLKGRDA